MEPNPDKAQAVGHPPRSLWGRVTPLQSDMLRLCGVAERTPLRAMEVGRVSLARETGCDFGYDLLAWHQHLVGSELVGAYAAGEAWDEVWAEIERALGSRERAGLVARVQASRG